MKYFFDTEFIDDGQTIDLISIGIVAEDGRELYLESADCDFTKAGDFVRQVVMPQLEGHAVHRSAIAASIKDFVGIAVNGFTPKPQFWAYYAAYDWVALCQLYGRMLDLPAWFPHHCMDIIQVCATLGHPKLPAQTHGHHHALDDARWNRDAYQALIKIGYRGALH